MAGRLGSHCPALDINILLYLALGLWSTRGKGEVVLLTGQFISVSCPVIFEEEGPTEDTAHQKDC